MVSVEISIYKSIKFIYFTDALRNNTVRQYFNEDFSKYSPIYFLYERQTPKSLEASKSIRSFYFQNKSLEFPQSLTSFGQLYAKHTSVYTYLFTYKGRYSYFIDPDTKKPMGKWKLNMVVI